MIDVRVEEKNRLNWHISRYRPGVVAVHVTEYTATQISLTMRRIYHIVYAVHSRGGCLADNASAQKNLCSHGWTLRRRPVIHLPQNRSNDTALRRIARRRRARVSDGR